MRMSARDFGQDLSLAGFGRRLAAVCSAEKQMQEDGRRARLLELAGHPPLAFLRNYLAHGGIRDGAPGFIISSMNAYYVFLKFAKLWELELEGVRGSGFKVQGSFEVQGSDSSPEHGAETRTQTQHEP